MDTPVAEVMVPGIFFATVFGITYVVITARHRQRMAMIEKGADPKMFVGNGNTALAFGLLLLGLGVGITLGYAADVMANGAAWGDSPGPYFVGCLVCGGGALVLYHWLMRRKKTDPTN